jgi:proline iminopeptidase
LARTLTLLTLLLATHMTLSQSTGVQNTGKAHTPDVDLAYLTFGTPTSALPLIAVNGGPGLSHIYMVQNGLWQQVAKHRLVVLYDQRGTGGSKPLREGASQSMDAQVADLDAVRAALHLEKFALLGDSYGGFLSIAYASANPEHVAKLILSDSPSAAMKDMVHVLPQVFPDIEEEAAAESKQLAATDPDAAARAGMRNHFRMIFYSPELRDKYMATMGGLGYEPSVARAVSAESRKVDYTANLAHFTSFPTLVLTGRYDMNVAPLTAWRLAHQIPGAKIVFFEKSGHLPAYEEPERYLQVLNDFLNQP